METSLRKLDKRTYVFDVSDLVIGIYSEDSTEHREEFTTPQRIRKKVDVVELVPGRKPYNLVYQVIYFEANSKMYLGELFKPFDQETKDKVKVRNEEAQLEYSEISKLRTTKTARLKNPRQVRIGFSGERFYKTSSGISYSVEKLTKKQGSTILYTSKYEGLVYDLMSNYSIKDLRVIKLNFVDKDYYTINDDTFEVILVNAKKDKDIIFLCVLYSETLTVPYFYSIGVKNEFIPSEDRKLAKTLEKEDIDDIINLTINKSLFKIK